MVADEGRERDGEYDRRSVRNHAATVRREIERLHR